VQKGVGTRQKGVWERRYHPTTPLIVTNFHLQSNLWDDMETPMLHVKWFCWIHQIRKSAYVSIV